MAEWFAFSDIDYYPWVVNDWDGEAERYRPIVADTAEEVAARHGVSVRGERLFVAPYEAVRCFEAPEVIDARDIPTLQREANQLRAARRDAGAP